jgi:hypothetical protein
MPKTSTWKKTERAVAQRLGGQRVGNRGTNTEDVAHEWLSIECKHKKELPTWLKLAMWQAKTNADADKLPVVVLHENGQRHADNLVVIRMADFQEWFGNGDSAEGCTP